MSLRSRYTSFIFVQLWDSGMYYKGIKKSLVRLSWRFYLVAQISEVSELVCGLREGFFFESG